MVRRLLALLLVAALAAGGCIGDATRSGAPALRPTSDGRRRAVARDGRLARAGSRARTGWCWSTAIPRTRPIPARSSSGDATATAGRSIPASGDRPEGRNFAGVAVDPGSRRLVLHGGLTRRRRLRRDLALGRRPLVASPPIGDAGPGPRSSPSMAFDEASGLTLLYGGDDGSEQYADTWAFDGSTWEQVARDGPAADALAGADGVRPGRRRRPVRRPPGRRRGRPDRPRRHLGLARRSLAGGAGRRPPRPAGQRQRRGPPRPRTAPRRRRRQPRPRARPGLAVDGVGLGGDAVRDSSRSARPSASPTTPTATSWSSPAASSSRAAPSGTRTPGSGRAIRTPAAPAG